MIALRLSGRFVCRQSRFQWSHEDHTPREFAGGNDPVVSRTLQSVGSLEQTSGFRVQLGSKTRMFCTVSGAHCDKGNRINGT